MQYVRFAAEVAQLDVGKGDSYSDISIDCDGDESSLLGCTIVQNPDCGYGSVAAVACTSPNCTHGSVRLIEGSSPYEGMLEICIGSEWRTVCHHEWDNADAKVVCQQLNYSTIGNT